MTISTQTACDPHRRALFAAYVLIRSAALSEINGGTLIGPQELGRAFDVPPEEAKEVMRRMKEAGVLSPDERVGEPWGAPRPPGTRLGADDAVGAYKDRQSIHPYEVILAYLKFQVDVLGRKHLYDLERFAGILHKGSRHSGSQDEEITLWRNSRFCNYSPAAKAEEEEA